MLKKLFTMHKKKKKSRLEIEIIKEAIEAVAQVEKAREDYRELIKKYGQYIGD